MEQPFESFENPVGLFITENKKSINMSSNQPGNTDAEHFAKIVANSIVKIDQLKQESLGLQQLNDNIDIAILEGKYADAIYLCMELKDRSQGISWHSVPAKEANLQHDILIRDARNATKSEQTYEPYIILALNYLRATKALLGDEKYNKIQSYLNSLMYSFYVNAKNNQDNIATVQHMFEHFNTVLVSNISSQLEIKFDDALERLSIAKDFANLEDVPKSIVTISNLKDINNQPVTVFQGDQPMTVLTPELVDEYIHRREKEWYKILPKWQQELVDKYEPFIREGSRIIPTQLRKILVGLRNSYRTVNGVIDPLTKTVEVTTDVYHSGTIVYLGKHEKENQRINSLHAKQLQCFTGTTDTLAITLNTQINPSGNDRTIVSESNTMMKAVKGFHANLPLNGARRVARNNYDGINDHLKRAGKAALSALKKYPLSDSESKSIDEIGRYLIKQEGLLFIEDVFLNLLLEDLKKIKDKLIKSTPEEDHKVINSLCNTLELAMNCCYLTHNNKNIFDADNRNLQIGSLMNLLSTELRKLKEFGAINSSCESGKDRDGVLMFKTGIMSFTKFITGHFNLNNQDSKINQTNKNNIITLSNNRHQQILAGLSGATIGAFGIKKDSKGVIPKNEFPEEAAEALIETTASYNKAIKVNKLSKNEMIYFPIMISTDNSNVTLAKQKEAIVHVLSLRVQQLEGLIPSNSLLSKFSGIFESSSIMKARLSLLSDAIKEIKKADSLEQIKSSIDVCATFNKSLTDGTPHSVGDTYYLLINTSKDLEVLINFDNRIKSGLV